MKKTILCAALAFASAGANAQQTESGKLFDEVVKTYNATPRPSDLHADEAFKSNVRKVIQAADSNTLTLLNNYTTFIYMNGMLNDVSKALAEMPKELKDSEEGIKAVTTYYAMRALGEGDKVPDFTLATPDGKQVNLFQFISDKKCVIIDFWASWCHWCRQENPNLKKTYEAFKDKGLGIISVSFDDKRDRWLKAVEEDQCPWTQVSDLKGISGKNTSEVYMQYDIQGIPAILLIDSKGTVLKLRMRGDEIYNSVNNYLNSISR